MLIKAPNSVLVARNPNFICTKNCDAKPIIATKNSQRDCSYRLFFQRTCIELIPNIMAFITMNIKQVYCVMNKRSMIS